MTDRSLLIVGIGAAVILVTIFLVLTANTAR